MRKVIILGLLASTFSSGVFADAATDAWTSSGVSPSIGEHDSAQATASWIGQVPTVVPGKWITFTGKAGGAISSGTLKIDADGLFSTIQPVTLEVHTFDPASNTVGDLLPVGHKLAPSLMVKVKEISYSVSDVDFESAKGSDLSSASGLVKLDNHVMAPSVPYVDSASDAAISEWTVESKNAASGFGHVIANDRISALANVVADIDFSRAII
ncbi:hypothetical protein [Photobacterium damselae]